MKKKKRCRKKKRKRNDRRKSFALGQVTNLDQFTKLMIDLLIQTQGDAVLTELLKSPDGRGFFHIHIPGGHEIEAELCLGDILNRIQNRNMEVIGPCKIH